MLPEALTVKNFMGYVRKCSIDFSGRGVVGIVGPNESGKSSLLQAISYALYGNTRAKSDKDLISAGATGDLVVELLLKLPDKDLAITRGRTLKGSPIMELSGYSAATKPSVLREALQEHLPLPYEDFLALTYFQQGDIHQFMGGNKLSFFSRWTASLAEWQDLQAIAEHKSSIAVEGLESALEGLEAKKASVAIAHELKTPHRASLERLAQANEAWGRAYAKVQDLKAQLLKSQDLKERDRRLQAIREEGESWKRKKARAEGSLKEAIAEKAQLSKGNCPILGIYCEPLCATSQEKARKVAERIEFIQLALAEANAAIDAARADYRAIQASFESAKGKEIKQALDLAQQELDQLDRDKSKLSRDVARMEQQIEQGEQDKKDIKALQLGIQAQRQELKRLRFISAMCGKSGIPSQILGREVTLLEQKCNWVLERLGYSKRLEFKPYRELSAFEKVCACGDSQWYKERCKSCGADRPRQRRDDLIVRILDGAYDRPFALESGGAQVFLSFAARLACSVFLSSVSGVPMRFVMLDEVFAMLDSERRQQLMSLVLDRLSSEFGLERQFVVSHHEDIMASVDSVLTVSRELGSSVARWS